MTPIPKRIAIVCFSFSWGGLELTTFRLSKAINERGIPTLLIVPPSSPLEQRAAEENLSITALAPRWKYGDFHTAKILARVLKENNIDIVILMRSQDIHLASLAMKYFPEVKFVFYQQMDSRHNKRDFIHSWIYSKLSLWISLTQGMKKNVIECTRMPSGKVTVVPLGTDLYRFDPEKYDRCEARKVFGLPENKKIIGVLGRLDPGKGQEVLLRSVPDVVKHHPDVFFVIAGDETAGEPGYKKQLEELCRTLAITQYIKFLPFTKEVPQLLAALDMFALPSFSETFGIVVIEAMAMRKPIVATNAGGVSEIIADGKTGVLVEPRNTKVLAHAICRLFDDDALRLSLANSARNEAVQRFDFNRCVDLLLDLVIAL
jgi:glycosyltransferase involved in cell wall biosynthesis